MDFIDFLDFYVMGRRTLKVQDNFLNCCENFTKVNSNVRSIFFLAKQK